MQGSLRILLAFIISACTLAGCKFGSEDESIIISGDFPLVYVKKNQDALLPSVSAVSYAIGTDLYWRDVSSPESVEQNLTTSLTFGKGDVADPEVSYDGKKIIFSMRCTTESSAFCNMDSSWNIWIYDIEQNSFSRVIQEIDIANLGDDIDPAFLPDGRIVFSSTRQKNTSEIRGYIYANENSQTPASVLHTMTANGENIEQISFNQSNDINPTVASDGKIIFSRWENQGHRNQLSIYSANPDGTDMNVLYGAHSPGEAFLNPRELPDGRLISTVLPMVGTWEGGALLTIDINNFSDADAPAPSYKNKAESGQQSATIQDVPLGNSVSRLGRFTSPYPLMDGSNDVLVSFSFFQKQENLEDETVEEDTELEEAPPLYGIYLLNIKDKSLKPLILPQDGKALVDPVAVFPKDIPEIILRNITFQNGIFDPEKPEGIINIKSVYDADRFARMGPGVLTANENAATPLPIVAQQDAPDDVRQFVIDIAKIKDPLQTTAWQRPARFLRVTESIPTPRGFSRQALGETDYNMRQLVGYAPIEPDGSVKIKVPADVPLALSVLDQYGRAYVNHTSWLQVRPGETLECNGCHSPKHTEAINKSPIAGSHINTRLRLPVGSTLFAQAEFDETMAETRTRLDESALNLSNDILYDDVWTDESLRNKDASVAYVYNKLNTPTPDDGVINYAEHIQPIWSAQRNINGQAQTCASCHNGINNENNPTALNLSEGIGSGGRLTSYEALMIGGVLYDEDGQPVYENVEERRVLRRASALVNAGYARGSYLIEKLYGQELFAEKSLPLFALDHSDMMTEDEKRLVVEWIDLGGQYFNSPFDEKGELITVSNTLDRYFFDIALHRLIVSGCQYCHASVKPNGAINPNFVQSRFILTGQQESDFFAVSSMVTNRSEPEKSYIVAVPSSTEIHPTRRGNEAYLPVDSQLYSAMLEWIRNSDN